MYDQVTLRSDQPFRCKKWRKKSMFHNDWSCLVEDLYYSSLVEWFCLFVCFLVESSMFGKTQTGFLWHHWRKMTNIACFDTIDCKQVWYNVWPFYVIKIWNILKQPWGASGIVTPHENCYCHHDKRISIHGVLPLGVLADVWKLFLLCHLLSILDLGASSSATEPTHHVTHSRLFLFSYSCASKEEVLLWVKWTDLPLVP